MRDACRRAVENALGRNLNQAELRDIETRIARNMRALARRDPHAWHAKPEPERLNEAGIAAARELVTEAKRRKDNLETRVVRMAALTDFVDTQVAEGRDQTRTDAFSRILAPRADAGGAPEGGALDQKAQGIYGNAVRVLADTFESGKRRGIWRFIPFNEPGTNAFLRRALAGETKGVPPEFVKMAKTVHDFTNLMRQRFNAAGGMIGRLEDWGEVHRWSDLRVIKAIKQRGRAAVVAEFSKAANPRRYVREDGSYMTPAEIHNFMDGALQSIISDGASERVAARASAEADGRSEHAASIAANRHRAHREIHLRPDAVADMLNRYSEMGAMESLLTHMRSLARDVALIETFGPNAELTATQMMDAAFDADLAAMPSRKLELNTKRALNRYLYDYLAGNAPGVRSGLGQTLGFLRSWATFKSLGFTVWSSLTDPVVMQHVAAARGLSGLKLWANDVALFTNNGRRWAKRAGLITESIVDAADRFNLDTFGGGARELGSRAASLTVKVTGLSWVTEARRAAWGMTMMDAIGHAVRYNERIASLKEADDRAFLRLLNVSEETWSLWRLAKLESRGGNHTLLSPQAIEAIPDAAIARLFPDAPSPALIRQDAITQLLGIIKDETNTAVITAGSRERGTLAMGTTSGTVAGELVRSAMLFKSFPWTYLTRQFDLARSIDGGVNRGVYAGSLIVSMWMTGIAIEWIYDILNGRDPGAVNPQSAEGRRRIIAGLLRGGGLGFFGDFLFANADPGARSQSLSVGLLGPVPALIDDAQQLTLGNLNQEAMGEESNFGPEAVSFAQRQLTPNWFYTRAALDRYIFNALQEELEPGYNARRTRRQFTNRGTTYFLPAEPGEPMRKPDLTRAVEGDMPERRKSQANVFQGKQGDGVKAKSYSAPPLVVGPGGVTGESAPPSEPTAYETSVGEFGAAAGQLARQSRGPMLSSAPMRPSYAVGPGGLPDTPPAAIAAREAGVPEAYLAALSGHESGDDPDAQAGTSSATGLGQFTDATWLHVMRNYGPNYGLGRGHLANLTKDDVLALRRDPMWSMLMTAEYARENEAVMRRALERPLRQNEIYLAHFLGPTDAVSLLRAAAHNNDAPASRAVSSAAVRDNPQVFYEGGNYEWRTHERTGRRYQRYLGGGRARSPAQVIALQSRAFSTAPFTVRERASAN